MSRYAAILVVPFIVGSLIAVTLLLINGLRERRERRHLALHEARWLDTLGYARAAGADEVPRTVSESGVGIASKDQRSVFEETPAGGDGRQEGRWRALG